MVAALLSLLGAPPLVGFVGKLFLFIAAIGIDTVQAYFLVGVGVFSVLVSCWYYLGIVKAMYVDRADADATPCVCLPPPARWCSCRPWVRCWWPAHRLYAVLGSGIGGGQVVPGCDELTSQILIAALRGSGGWRNLFLHPPLYFCLWSLTDEISLGFTRMYVMCWL